MNAEHFETLRTKLDLLGYSQPIPLGAVAIVGALFEDLVKTTESLRDDKLKISKLLEEKSCWELGVEPYKCNNAVLLEELNTLHLDLIRQREYYEERCLDHSQKIRNLESDKRHLEDHTAELEKQLALKFSDTKSLKNRKNGVNMNRKPFVSSVRAGVFLPNPNEELLQSGQCNKCSCCMVSGARSRDEVVHELQKLQNEIKDSGDRLTYYKDKVKLRDREIERLQNLLSGGRPAAALAKDCCYKNVGILSEDVEILQQEKLALHKKLRESADKMHEAMNRAMVLEEKSNNLEKQLNEFESTALNVESQANLSLREKEDEIKRHKDEVLRLKRQLQGVELEPEKYRSEMDSSCDLRKLLKVKGEEKRQLCEQINKLKSKVNEYEIRIQKLERKNTKLKTKLTASDSIVESKIQSQVESHKMHKAVGTCPDEELIRLKAERDFFQKEYLRLIEKSGSEREIDCLKSQLVAKDKDLSMLRCERSHMRCTSSQRSGDHTPNSVQATILRAERERNAIKADLELTRNERDCLGQKLRATELRFSSEKEELQNQLKEKSLRLAHLEKESREARTTTATGQTYNAIMQQEIEELKRHNFELEKKNSELNTNINRLRILQDQMDKALVDSQNKLVVTESKLQNAEMRLIAFESSRDTARNEKRSIEQEFAALKSHNSHMETEKEEMMSQLDKKTERIYKLEAELNCFKQRKQDLEELVKNLEKKIEGFSTRNKKHESDTEKTDTERKKLRQDVATLKSVKDQLITENSRLSNEFADSQADVIHLKRKLKDSEKEVESLRQQLKKYVHEVQKAEEVLSAKEHEREEMLEHYKHLSHDAVVLEGNNQSLEFEAAEQKRQLQDAEALVIQLKYEITTKDKNIVKFEKQVAALSAQVSEFQKELEEAYDDQRLVKVDLDAMHELCNKLDQQKEKINAELNECQKIRSQLEHDNEKLRKDLSSIRTGDKAAVDSLQELLTACRQDLDVHRKLVTQYKREIENLKSELYELKNQLDDEKSKAIRNEALAQEYNVQVQELRHDITNDRFQQARSRDVSPRFIKLENISSGDGLHRNTANYTLYSDDSNTPKEKKETFNEGYFKDVKLLKGIKRFLNKGKIIKDKSQNFIENITFSEDSNDIVVRRQRRIITKTTKTRFDDETPSSSYVSVKSENTREMSTDSSWISEHVKSESLSCEKSLNNSSETKKLISAIKPEAIKSDCNNNHLKEVKVFENLKVDEENSKTDNALVQNKSENFDNPWIKEEINAISTQISVVEPSISSRKAENMITSLNGHDHFQLRIMEPERYSLIKSSVNDTEKENIQKPYRISNSQLIKEISSLKVPNVFILPKDKFERKSCIPIYRKRFKRSHCPCVQDLCIKLNEISEMSSNNNVFYRRAILSRSKNGKQDICTKDNILNNEN